MRILLIHQYFLEKDEGGGSRFNTMSKAWADQGHHISVLAGMVHYATGTKRDEYKGKLVVHKPYLENIDVYRCHVSESYNRSFVGRLWAYLSFVFSSVYAGLFKTQENYDLILVTSPPLFVGITAYILAKVKRIPFGFEVRDLWPESAIDTGVLRNKFIIKLAYWFEGFMYRSATLVNVLTPAFRDKLIYEKGVPKEKVIFVPNAADFTLADYVRNNFDAQAFREAKSWGEKFVITYVGAHGVANHLIQVLDAAELIEDERVHFVLIGAGMRKKYLMEEAARRSLSNVEFIDSVPKEEVYKYIFASDVGTSVLKKVETFKTIYSNKTFDYMSCQKPVLMVIDGVSRQLVEDATCGVYAEPDNAQAIADQATWLSSREPSELARMGENGYRYAKQHFDRQVLADQYISKLVEVVR